jgi:hypothetical protein
LANKVMAAGLEVKAGGEPGILRLRLVCSVAATDWLTIGTSCANEQTALVAVAQSVERFW